MTTVIADETESATDVTDETESATDLAGDQEFYQHSWWLRVLLM